MSEPDASFATEPITPRGLVAFAHASVARLWLVQLLAAILVAVSVLWFFNDRCAPTFAEAIRNLSGAGEIHNGELVWHGAAPKVLAEERFLALVIDLNHSHQIYCTSVLQVEFGRDSIRVASLFGFADFAYPDYPPNQIIPVSRNDLEPLWGAWLVEIQAILVAVMVAGLWLAWNVLATLYWLPVWLLAWLTGRELSLGGGWRLAGASLLPGALLLALGIFLFDFGLLDLIQFGLLVGAHLLLGWLYLFVGLLFLPPRGSTPLRKNPFEPGK